MDGNIDVVDARTPEGLGFHLKVRSSGKLFRVMPARWPPQPRFWCLCIYRCKPGGMADPAERPWFGSSGMTREELPAATEAIRADIEAWLAQEGLHDLRAWLLTQDEVVVAEPVGTGPSVRSSVTRAKPLDRPR